MENCYAAMTAAQQEDCPSSAPLPSPAPLRLLRPGLLRALKLRCAAGHLFTAFSSHFCFASSRLQHRSSACTRVRHCSGGNLHLGGVVSCIRPAAFL